MQAGHAGPRPRHERHHDIVEAGVKHIAREEQRIGGQLGRPSGARFRVYTRLKAYADSIKGQPFDAPELHRALDDIYHYPLRQAAVDTLNRQLRIGVDDAALAQMVIAMRDEDRLCLTENQNAEVQEPRIICSLGTIQRTGGWLMRVRTDKLRRYLHSFDFQNLFVEGLGWDFYRAGPTGIRVDGQEYVLEPVAEKAGFAVYVCSPNADGKIPDYPVRRKIERKVAKLAFEHLIIFIDTDKTVQVWQWGQEGGRQARRL